MDCICCGFGAIILLLVLTDVDQPVVIERAREAMNGQLLRLQEELFVIRGETDQLNRELQGRIAELRAERSRLARAAGRPHQGARRVRGQQQRRGGDQHRRDRAGVRLPGAHRRDGAAAEAAAPRAPVGGSVGGIPVDSEYVVFVIDTSNSMVSMHWEATLDIMREILDIYPEVKGLQVMNDQGRYMFERHAGPLAHRLGRHARPHPQHAAATGTPYSESNPVPGIEQALRAAPHRRAQRISIYVIGDEFTGESIQAAVDCIAASMRADPASGRGRASTPSAFRKAPACRRLQTSAFRR